MPTIEPEVGLGYSFSVSYDYGLEIQSGEFAGGTTTTTATPTGAAFGGSATFPASPTATTGNTGGGQSIAVLSSTAGAAAATSIGAAAFVGSLSRTVEASATAAPATATPTVRPPPTTATTATSGGGAAVTTAPSTTQATAVPAAPTPTVSASGAATAATATAQPGEIFEWLLRSGGDLLRIDPTDVEATANTVRLDTVVEDARVDRFRALGNRAGDLDLTEAFGGVFRATDRRDAPSIDVLPRSDYRPAVTSETTLPASFEESQAGPGHYEISLELQRTANRDDATTVDTTRLSTGSDWSLELDTGRTIGLSSQDVTRTDRGGTASGEEVSLSLLVNRDQAAALADRLGFPAAVVKRPIPDADSIREDASPEGRQTVTLSVPTESPLSGGEFVVPDWSLRAIKSTADDWEFAVVLVPIP